MDEPGAKISEIYAFVHDTPSGEKVVAGRIASNLLFHLIHAGNDPEVLRRFAQYAQQSANSMGQPVRLIRATGIEVIDTIVPARTPPTHPEGES